MLPKTDSLFSLPSSHALADSMIGVQQALASASSVDTSLRPPMKDRFSDVTVVAQPASPSLPTREYNSTPPPPPPPPPMNVLVVDE